MKQFDGFAEELKQFEEKIYEAGKKLETKIGKLSLAEVISNKVKRRNKQCDQSHEIVQNLIEKNRKIKKLYNKKSDSNISDKDRDTLNQLKKKVNQTKEKISFF